jgi:hypothetical protein
MAPNRSCLIWIKTVGLSVVIENEGGEREQKSGDRIWEKRESHEKAGYHRGNVYWQHNALRGPFLS